jgi:hypothetical protein
VNENEEVWRCREIVNRLRAQVEFHLPPILGNYGYPDTNAQVQPQNAIPLERLPTIGTIVGQLLDAEAKLAALVALQPIEALMESEPS